jgi:hypothetical protein
MGSRGAPPYAGFMTYSQLAGAPGGVLSAGARPLESPCSDHFAVGARWVL